MPRLDYFAPGVYIEEVNRGSRPIEGVPTAVAGFVGFTEDIRGGAAPLTPMLVTNWDQYLAYFGRPNSDGFTDFNAYLPFSVYGWFLNGGGRCWVVSLGTQLPGTEPQDISRWLSEEFNRRSQFAALYYPWITVANPRDNGRPISIPPCGYAMGVWARTDETRGVYKAPANEVPRGVLGLAYDCNFREQELLNPKGINCIRSFANQGIRIWGARTLVEPDQTEWRYINVRRLMSYIEKSVELGTQWAVFEPNDEDLWARVTRTISNFLTGLWRQGALMGNNPSQAFYVKCDGELNTPDSMILGRLYVEIGVAPVRPAEFVIFRFSQWTGQDEG